MGSSEREKMQAESLRHNIVVGVTGGIAAYKAVELCSRLRKTGAQIRVTMTKAATKFVTPLTFETIANYPAVTDMFERSRAWEMDHIADARWAELIVVVPATANIIAKIAHGIADCPVSTLVLAYDGPLVVAPAMNTVMYQSAATQQNLQILRQRGVYLVEPGVGRLACGEVGAGRLAEIEDIMAAIVAVLCPRRDLQGKRVLITAGPTREFIDPARFLSNPSTGRMGYALAEAALERGAEVVLISGPTSLQPPAQARTETITTTAELLEAVKQTLDSCDIAIFAAAPADYRAANPQEQKSAKHQGEFSLQLQPTDDVAAWAGQHRRDGQTLVCFAAETHEAEAHAREKMQRKNADYIVVNDIGRRDIGFASIENEVVILGRHGRRQMIEKASKKVIAQRILDVIADGEHD